jgi:hypothetical protein
MKSLAFPSSGLLISQACIQEWVTGYIQVTARQCGTWTLVAAHWDTGKWGQRLLLDCLYLYITVFILTLLSQELLPKMKYKVLISLWLVEKKVIVSVLIKYYFINWFKSFIHTSIDICVYCVVVMYEGYSESNLPGEPLTKQAMRKKIHTGATFQRSHCQNWDICIRE